MSKTTTYTLLLIFTALPFCFKTPKPKRLTVLTVAGFGETENSTKSTDSLDRLRRIGKFQNLRLKILTPFENLEEERSKVNFLRQELENGESYSEEEEEDVILFSESHEILLLGQADEILNRFLSSYTDILISSSNAPAKHQQKYCEHFGDLLIGYKSSLLAVLQKLNYPGQKSQVSRDCHWNSIGQQIYGSNCPNGTIKVKLDVDSTLFHTVHHDPLTSDRSKKLVLTETGSTLINPLLKNKILILQSDGHPRSTLTLNMYENNLLNWQPGKNSCGLCTQDTITLENLADYKLPFVTLAIFIETPTPFLEEFFQGIRNLDYPKRKIHLFLFNHVPYHAKLVGDYLAQYSVDYAKVYGVNLNTTKSEQERLKLWEGRQLAVNFALEQNSEYYFSVDSKAHLENPLTLKRLIEQNRGIVSPLLTIPHTLVSNFWAALDIQGFYDRSKDYAFIVKAKRRGLWNIPVVTGIYLVHPKILHSKNLRPNFTRNFPTPDLAFCSHMRKNGVFIQLTNRENWGHFINADKFKQELLVPGRQHPELYEFFSNTFVWKKRYMHPDWSKGLNSLDPPAQPCRDVFAFPLVTPRFCRELIEEMETHGNWSGTNDYDVDPAPTADIGLDQIDLEYHWIEFVREHVLPLQERVYPHYKISNMKWDTPYVIRYHADGRKILNPHHDRSTYTVNVALNRAGIDFEGGGLRFVRYNCSLLDNKVGWLLIHPGQLTHLHQGLVVTKGRRYVLITFINPH